MREWIKMADSASLSDKKTNAQVHSGDVGAPGSSLSSKDAAHRDQATSSEIARLDSDAPILQQHQQDPSQSDAGEYRVYKRRWFGLFQLVLLNVIVSWDVRSDS
jgi:hypothetical protein